MNENQYENIGLNKNQLNNMENFSLEIQNEYNTVLNILWFICGLLSMSILMTLGYYIHNICDKKNKISVVTAETVPLLNTIDSKIDNLKEVIVDLDKTNNNSPKNTDDQNSVMAAYT